MYIIDFKNRTIANFSNKRLSSFLNDIIIYNQSTIKNYYFLNTKKEAESIIKKQMKANNGWKRLGKAIYGLLCSGYSYGIIDNPI